MQPLQKLSHLAGSV